MRQLRHKKDDQAIRNERCKELSEIIVRIHLYKLNDLTEGRLWKDNYAVRCLPPIMPGLDTDEDDNVIMEDNEDKDYDGVVVGVNVDDNGEEGVGIGEPPRLIAE